MMHSLSIFQEDTYPKFDSLGFHLSLLKKLGGRLPAKGVATTEISQCVSRLKLLKKLGVS